MEIKDENNDVDLDIWEYEQYVQGMRLAFWRLLDFLLLADELFPYELELPVKKPIAAAFELSDEDLDQARLLAKVTSCFLIGFTAFETLLNAISGVAIYLYLRQLRSENPIELTECEFASLLEQREDGKWQNISVTKKLNSYPELLAKITSGNWYLDKKGKLYSNFEYCKNKRHSLAHTKANWNGDNRCTNDIYVELEDLVILLWTYTNYLRKVINVSEQCLDAFQVFEKLLEKYNGQILTSYGWFEQSLN